MSDLPEPPQAATWDRPEHVPEDPAPAPPVEVTEERTWQEDADRERAAHDEDERQRAAAEQRTAVRMAHPRMRMEVIMTSLRSPAATAGDPATKFAYLHSAVVQMLQLMISQTPPPEDEHGEERIEREHAQGHDEQEPVSL